MWRMGGVSCVKKKQAECFLTHILMLYSFHWIETKMVCETPLRKKNGLVSDLWGNLKIGNTFVILTPEHMLISTVFMQLIRMMIFW